ncbi:MAG: glutamate racemase [Candidatus Colwellbacteria bacterium]|nr:glutamate racemase [Candidatus Colwellbacteria bacterium]
MIGFFDSGFGGLTVLKEVTKSLPGYSYIYLGDNARAPYGDRDQDEIYQFTKEGVIALFGFGAELVILACNTSSSSALRKVQQEFLPRFYPDKKVLGIIIPTAEEINTFTKTGEVGVLGTTATILSRAYEKEIKKADPSIKVHGVACPLLVPMLEAGEIEGEALKAVLRGYLNKLFTKASRIDSIILGCTHYALIEGEFKSLLPRGVKLVSQGPIIAAKLEDYFSRHPEIENGLGRRSGRRILATKDSPALRSLRGVVYRQYARFGCV